ncbi:MAG: DUF1788 domain-containing protein [Faecalicoccus sp.]|nr:DUF1788 domain-containing protein [Faecalicoccus sp.]
MAKINERLDGLKSLMQSSDFLEGRGLSNEVNIRMFCYDPKEEMVVRHFVQQLQNENLSCRVIHYDLYEVFLDILRDKRILNRIEALEVKKGKDNFKKQLDNSCNPKIFAAKMNYSDHQKGDVVVLSGVGKVFPFMRVHSLLEAMQPYFLDVPILVLYPGDFDGHYVRLFNKLKKNEYYRAFKVV